MAVSLKVSGTLLFRVIGVVLIFFFHEVFFGILLIVFARRLSNALDLDEKLGQLGSAARSLPRTRGSGRKQKPRAAPQEDRLFPCPYCGRDIKPGIRKCRSCNHTL